MCSCHVHPRGQARTDVGSQPPGGVGAAWSLPGQPHFGPLWINKDEKTDERVTCRSLLCFSSHLWKEGHVPFHR